jgi:hypothetical protein
MISTLPRTDLNGQTLPRAAGGGICDGLHPQRREVGIAELTHELTTAVDGAYWTYMLQAELEDAFDTALLRAAMSETPILVGPLTAWSSQPGAMAS